LARIMNRLPRVEDPRLIVGLETGDDAGVFRLTEDMALVQTVDVFTPVVDDPYTFGQIVAANCMSDVWAMGGDPLTALNLFGYPRGRLDDEDAALILQGCAEKIREAGAVLCGGHTWVDSELKAGLAVTGTVHPKKAVTNAGARPGDALVLTKPLGGGIISLASAKGMVGSQIMEPVVQSMIELNKAASKVMRSVGVSAATDVTGFSLLGHASVMAEASGVGLEIRSLSVPVFLDALDLAEKGVFLPLGQGNANSFEDRIRFHPDVSKAMVRVLFDPQTSGGLLISVEQKKKELLLGRLHEQGILSARIIGSVGDVEKGKVRVV
jgi:selenide,water dikinase